MIPISIIHAHRFYDTITNFLGLIRYWASAFITVIILEHLVIQHNNPAECDLDDWDAPIRLPSGITALSAGIASFRLVISCICQVWFTGPITKTTGDIGFEVAFGVIAVLYLPLCLLESRILGHVWYIHAGHAWAYLLSIPMVFSEISHLHMMVKFKSIQVVLVPFTYYVVDNLCWCSCHNFSNFFPTFSLHSSQLFHSSFPQKEWALCHVFGWCHHSSVSLPLWSWDWEVVFHHLILLAYSLFPPANNSPEQPTKSSTPIGPQGPPLTSNSHGLLCMLRLWPFPSQHHCYLIGHDWRTKISTLKWSEVWVQG